jgi:hypothetical protein
LSHYRRRKSTHLDVIITIVVQIENPVDFAVFAHVYVFGSLQALANGLSCIFFHLNVIELSVGNRKKRRLFIIGILVEHLKIMMVYIKREKLYSEIHRNVYGIQWIESIRVSSCILLFSETHSIYMRQRRIAAFEDGYLTLNITCIMYVHKLIIDVIYYG